MALLEMCIEKGLDIACAHVNYHTRAQSETEEAYVRSFCKEHHLVCHVQNGVFRYTGNFEAAARDYRYAFFNELVGQYGYAGVMTAHQEDDLLETWFMQREKNLVPETYGLARVSMYRGMRIYRPLLGYTKQELEDYCRKRHIRYYIDETNLADEHTRNRVRHTRIENMTREEKDDEVRKVQAANARQKEIRRASVSWLEQGSALSAYRKLNEEERCTAIRYLTAQKHASKKYMQEIDHILMTREDILIQIKDRWMISDHGALRMMNIPEGYAYTLHKEEKIREKWFSVAAAGPSVCGVCVKDEEYPLTVRNVQAGDKIRMRFGEKSVHRFFIDRKIPKYMRSTWPVVLNRQGEVILVPGIGCERNHYDAVFDIFVVPYHLW